MKKIIDGVLYDSDKFEKITPYSYMGELIYDLCYYQNEFFSCLRGGFFRKRIVDIDRIDEYNVKCLLSNNPKLYAKYFEFKEA